MKVFSNIKDSFVATDVLITNKIESIGQYFSSAVEGTTAKGKKIKDIGTTIIGTTIDIFDEAVLIVKDRFGIKTMRIQMNGEPVVDICYNTRTQEFSFRPKSKKFNILKSKLKFKLRQSKVEINLNDF